MVQRLIIRARLPTRDGTVGGRKTPTFNPDFAQGL